MPEYPIEVEDAAGSHWKDGKLSICGGWTGSTRINNCYLLDNGQWKANVNNQWALCGASKAMIKRKAAEGSLSLILVF